MDGLDEVITSFTMSGVKSLQFQIGEERARRSIFPAPPAAPLQFRDPQVIPPPPGGGKAHFWNNCSRIYLSVFTKIFINPCSIVMQKNIFNFERKIGILFAIQSIFL
jgi:hypothetical protein